VCGCVCNKGRWGAEDVFGIDGLCVFMNATVCVCRGGLETVCVYVCVCVCERARESHSSPHSAVDCSYYCGGEGLC